MKKTILIFSLLILVLHTNAQRYMTKTGYIGFYSHTPLEDIKADNNQVASVMDLSTGDIVFQVLIKSFQFQKALMQVHFNENFLESEKYPRSTFKGKIVNYESIDIKKPGEYEVTVEGDLTLHNVTRKISEKGIIEIQNGILIGTSKFIITPEDYDITIPRVVRDNIAKTIEVTVNIKYSPVENN